MLSNGATHLELTISANTTGTVTLAGANTYNGVTNVGGGTLRVTNTTGSAIGSGSLFVSGSLMGSTAAGQGFIGGPVTISSGGKLLASSGATLTINNNVSLAAGSSSTFTLSGTPNGATGSPLIATVAPGGTSLTVTATHTINVNPLSTINVPNGMPYALYELYGYNGTAPSISGAQTPFTGAFAAGTAPSGFNLGLFEGTAAGSIISNNQVDVAVGAKPFVYLKTGDAAGATSFNATGQWSNGAAPSSASNYVVSVSSLRSPTGATAATFAGNSLTLGAGGQFGIKTTGNGTTTTIPTLVLDGGGVTNSQGSDGVNYTDVLAGTNIFLMSTSSFDTLSGGTGTRNLTIAAPISGPGGVIINPTSGSVGTLTFTKANTYTGLTTIDSGTLAFSGQGSLGSLTGAPLTMLSGFLDLNGTSQQLGNLTGTAGTILNNGAGTSTLTVGYSFQGAGNFAGVIADNNNGGSGTVALTKSGIGTISLDRISTYTGPTNVLRGELAVTGGLGNTPITVAGDNDALFRVETHDNGGNVNLGGTAIASAGATLTLPGSSGGPGPFGGALFDMFDNSIGTVHLNQGASISTGLTLGGSRTAGTAPKLGFEISDNGTTTTVDRLVVSNGVSVGSGGGATIEIRPVGSNPLHAGTYPVITAGSFTNSAGFFLSTSIVSVGANEYWLSLSNTGTSENLTVSPIALPTAYWTGARDANWNTVTGGATNWLNGPTGTDIGALPSAGTNVVFTANSATNLTTTFGADFAINSLTFTGTGTSATSTVTISGNTLTIYGSGGNNFTTGNGIVVQAGSGTHTIASNVIVGGVQSWRNNSSNPLTVTGGISDGGHNFDLTIDGAGPVVLSGNNTYGGVTTITSGSTLTLSGANSTTEAFIVYGTLNVNGSSTLGSSTVYFFPGASVDNTSAGSVVNTGANPCIWDANWSFGGTRALNLGAGSITAYALATTISLGGANSSLTFGGMLTNASGSNQTLTIDGPGNVLTIGGYALSNYGTSLVDSIGGSGNVTITGPVINGGTATSSGLVYSGTGILTLDSTSNYGGTTIVASGTLTTAATGTIGSGPLAINGNGATSVVNLRNTQSIGGLSGSVSNGGSARLNVAPGSILTINQTEPGTFAGTVALAAGSPGAGASLVKNRDSPLEIDGGLALGDNSSLAVNAGTLKISVTTGSPSVGNGVVATVSGTGTLELAGSVSALGTAVAANRTSIHNTSAATAGVLVSAGNQQVGRIDGLGNVAVGDGTSLTADHITAGALAIGGNSALVTIAPSAADGGPLGVARGGLLGVTDGLAEAQAGSAEPFVLVSSPLAPPSAGDAVGPVLADSTAASPDTNAGATSAVPEPASFVLLFLGAAFLFGRLRPAGAGAPAVLR